MHFIPNQSDLQIGRMAHTKPGDMADDEPGMWGYDTRNRVTLLMLSGVIPRGWYDSKTNIPSHLPP